jgi:non-ribosomal peptide synthetase component F
VSVQVSALLTRLASTPASSSAMWRGGLLFAALAFACLLVASSVLAQAAGVPAELQAELLAKLGAHDRNFHARAGTQARILILVKPGNAKSNLSAATMRSALAQLDTVGGLPHEEILVAYDNAASVAQLCRVQKAAIVYVTTGFDAEIEALRKALSGVDVLSVSASPEHVPLGIVLGFELVSGKPKIVLNLKQAKEQNVNFKADVLRLMKVYR